MKMHYKEAKAIKAKVYGIICFGMGLTLRDGNREYFYAKLDEHFPRLKQKYQKEYGYSYEVCIFSAIVSLQIHSKKR